MSRQEAYERAAASYHQAGYRDDAARCYRLAGAHRRAAELYEALGEYALAADAYADAGLPELGAWLLAHRAADPAAARARLAALPDRTPDAGNRPRTLRSAVTWRSGRDAEAGRDTDGGGARRVGSLELRYRLIEARCALAEGARPESVREVVALVCDVMTDSAVLADQYLEDWAVALSEQAQRFDQAALVFAAAVRGGRLGSAQRWNRWSQRVLGADVILPPASPSAIGSTNRPANPPAA